MANPRNPDMPDFNDILVAGILAAGMLLSIRRKKLTIMAAITGALLGWLIYAGAGFTGLGMLTIFFVMGTAATGLNRPIPGSSASITTDGSGSTYQPTRRPGQVIANAGVAAITGFLMVVVPSQKALFHVMMAGSMAAAAADTLSSELGMAYGSKFYNICTMRPDKKGLDGVISVEGMLFGLAGSTAIAIIYAIGNQWNLRFFIIVVAGTIGNLADSFLGATLERRRLISNDLVNMLNTFIAAIAAAIFFFL
jgi:uncharacterized protein (TIGR00297 family)